MTKYVRTASFDVAAGSKDEIVTLTAKPGERLNLLSVQSDGSSGVYLEVWLEQDQRVNIDTSKQPDINHRVVPSITAEPGETIKIVINNTTASAVTGLIYYEYERVPAT